VFLVRAENTQGVSVPSGLSNAIKTLGEDFDAMPSNELSAARTLLTAKVGIKLIFNYNISLLLLLIYLIPTASSNIKSLLIT